MTSQEFIEKEYRNDNGKSRYFCSISKDMNGNIYSYGAHYPLLFRVAGLDFVNVAGYSVTTSKHIGWAKAAVGYEYIGVELSRDDSYTISRSWSTEAEKLAVIRAALERKQDELTRAMLGKRRTNTAVYADLQRQFNEVTASLATIDATAGVPA